MDKATAIKILELAKAAKAERWYIRRPTEEMKKASFTFPPLLVQRKEGSMPYDQDVLAEDYGVTSDELRDAHIEFILAAAQHMTELAEAWLETDRENNPEDYDPKVKEMLNRVRNDPKWPQ
jgi:hypothetical protein